MQMAAELYDGERSGSRELKEWICRRRAGKRESKGLLSVWAGQLCGKSTINCASEKSHAY
jgi:hypothetical protein